MRAEEVLTKVTVPLSAPPYPLGRYRFTDREYLNVFYRTSLSALRSIVPEPLEIDEPLVRFEVMHMGDVGGFGPYTEAGIAVPVRFGEERGEYLHAMYLDNFPAIACGRELSAYPKSFGTAKLFADSGALVGTLDVGSLRVATATMGYKHCVLSAEEALRQITVPTYMVKIVPGYDARPRIAELVRAQITDVTVTQAWSGPARLQLFEHVLAPLADLPVLEVVSASHIVADLTLAGAVPVHDYVSSSVGSA
ncbi:acetoacetate decarboxylase [Allokutzneria multivorans]|uniref:Acetoacetate decarboxylase n=1 Tax=Allokutzneria multivorans TaxID=1142134 RepID=A0ABP7SMI2_9PSEU